MKISVCVAAYNGSEYIREQIMSILESLDSADIVEFELLVSDDGSTDDTLDVVRSIKDCRIKILQGPRNGLIKNFEFLLYRSVGEHIFLSDQDDVWTQEKVEKCLQYLVSYDLVVSDAVVVNKDLCVMHDSLFELNGSGAGFYKNLLSNTYVGCCMCFRRKVFIDVGCLPFPRNVPMHDWWIGLLFERKANVVFIDDKLVLYRRHENNASGTGRKSNASLATRGKWRANLIGYILKRM